MFSVPVNHYCFSQSMNISVQVTDCNNNAKISKVFIYDSDYKLLGETDSNGKCMFTLRHFPVFFEKAGYDIVPIYKRNLFNHVCMDKKQIELDEINIVAKKINIKDYLLRLRDENLPYFITNDTTLYYQFSYLWEIPERQWKEEATGYISFRWRPHKSFLPIKSNYIQYHYHTSDNSFLTDPTYDSIEILGTHHLLRFDIMGNSSGYELWKRLTGRKETEVNIPLPSFVGHKARKRNQDFDDGNLYDQVIRSLILRNKKGNHVFETHFDTSGYVLERIIFDSLNRLRRVEYFTPEQIASGSIPISASVRERNKSFSRLNNDNNFYYSQYVYDTVLPRKLQNAEHISISLRNGLYYRYEVKLNLVDSIPQQDFKVPDYRTKGKEVLEWINAGIGSEKK